MSLTKLILDNSAEFSMWARTSVVISGNGAATGLSFGLFGLEGNLPLLPFKLSDRTTANDQCYTVKKLLCEKKGGNPKPKT